MKTIVINKSDLGIEKGKLISKKEKFLPTFKHKGKIQYKSSVTIIVDDEIYNLQNTETMPLSGEKFTYISNKNNLLILW